MAGRGGQPNGENNNNTEAFAAVLALFIALICFVIWTYARPVIVIPALAVDYAIIWVMEHTVGIHETGQKYKEFIANFFNGTYSPATDMTWSVFMLVRTTVGNNANEIFAAIAAALAGYVYLNMKGNGYTRIFSLADKIDPKKKKKKGKPSFGKYQAEQWKVATYASQFDPDGRDKAVGPALTPTEWLQREGISWENGRFDDASRLKLVEAFRAQLGAPWHGFARATLLTQAVLVLAALHYLGSMEEYLKYGKVAITEREDLNIAWAGDKDGTEATKALVEKYKNVREVVRVIDHFCKENGFEHTAIFNFITIARKKSGIFKDADMGYVKRVNRSLWYTLNNCGRHAYHIEGAAVVNHYKAERARRAPVREGRVTEAIVGLEAYLNGQGISSLTEFFRYDDIFADEPETK